MKERLTYNLGLKLLSIFAAFFVWLVVVNISNPLVTRSKEVPVEIENEGILTSAKLTYEIVGKSSVTVSYEVHTRDEYKVKAGDFRAYVDLADLYDVTGSVPVKVEVLNNKELLYGNPAAVAKPAVLRIETESVQSKRFDLQVAIQGTPEEGFAIGDYTLSSDYLIVTGPVSLVGQINSVGIEIEVDGANSDLKQAVEPVLYDANGNKLSLGEKVTLSRNEISYELQVLKAKNLALDFAIQGTVASGYRYTGIESDTKSISIVGLKSVLASLTSITIPESELNLEGATKDRVVQVDISKYLPPSAKLVGSQSMVTVTMKVEALSNRNLSLNTDQIAMTGMSDDYSYEWNQKTISLTIQGLEEDLAGLTEADIHATLDVAGLAAGEHKGKLTFQLGEGFEVRQISEFTVMILPAEVEESAVVAPIETSEDVVAESTGES